MKNIVAKAPTTSQSIIIFASHYDTKRLDNFVGANERRIEHRCIA